MERCVAERFVGGTPQNTLPYRESFAAGVAKVQFPQVVEDTKYRWRYPMQSGWPSLAVLAPLPALE